MQSSMLHELLTSQVTSFQYDLAASSQLRWQTQAQTTKQTRQVSSCQCLILACYRQMDESMGSLKAFYSYTGFLLLYRKRAVHQNTFSSVTFCKMTGW